MLHLLRFEWYTWCISGERGGGLGRDLFYVVTLAHVCFLVVHFDVLSGRGGGVANTTSRRRVFMLPHLLTLAFEWYAR